MAYVAALFLANARFCLKKKRIMKMYGISCLVFFAMLGKTFALFAEILIFLKNDYRFSKKKIVPIKNRPLYVPANFASWCDVRLLCHFWFSPGPFYRTCTCSNATLLFLRQGGAVVKISNLCVAF